MKKLLALVLALVMTMGLATISSNAAFSDQDKIDHAEAVEVLTSLDVINGMPNGSFDPAGDVTRAQMAKMIAIIMLGADVNDSAFVGVPSTLTDINGHWAEGFIKYCVSQGIVAGKGDGTFKPDDKVTTTEAAKMLLVALGYNSDVQNYTGEQWAINVTKDASVKKLFDKLTGMTATKAVNRDEAAQMIWNTLQRGMIIKTAGQERTSDGKITDSYHDTSYDANPVTLLGQTFEGDIWIGRFDGNDKSLAGMEKDSIRVFGDLDENYEGLGVATATSANANFPWTGYGMENIGEETKVIFKDGTSGNPGRPDRFDTIYGVFNTGTTRILNAARKDIDDSFTKGGRLKVNDVEYDVAAAALNLVSVNYGGYAAAEPAIVGTGTGGANQWCDLSAKTGDNVKFIFDDNGNIARAYLTQSKITKITGVNGNKVTLQGFGQVDFSENGSQIYSGAAKDDVVIVTRFYTNVLGDATFVVTKAETLSGKITAYDGTKSVTIDGTKYTIHTESLPASKLTDDAIQNADLDNDKIGETVTAYMINGLVGALQQTSKDTYNYALLIDDNGKPTAGVDTGKVKLLLADGTKKTYDVSDKSTNDYTDWGTIGATVNPKLVKYNVKSDGSVNIEEFVQPVAMATGAFWDKDTKVVNTGALFGSGVATTDCVLFVTSTPSGTGGALTKEDVKAYNIRGLKDITAAGENVALIKNSSGQVVAAYFAQNGSINNSDTIYGYVTGVNGIVKHGDDAYREVVIWTGTESLNVYIAVNTAGNPTAGTMLEKRDFVIFNSAANYEYDTPNDFIVMGAATAAFAPTPAGTTYSWRDVAVDEYDDADRTLTFLPQLQLTSGVYEQKTGVNAVTLALDKECKIIYVNADGAKAGDEIGIVGFDTSTGFPNVKIVTDDASKTNIVAVFVETDGDDAVNFHEGTNAPVPSAPLV